MVKTVAAALLLTVNFNAKVGDTVSGPFELKVDIVEEREVFFTYTGNMNFAEGNLSKWVTEGAAEFNIASSGLEGYKGNAVTVISGDEASILKTDGPVFRGLEGREYRIRFYGSHSEGNGSINAEFLRYDEGEKNVFIEEADEAGDDAVQLTIDSDQWQVYETGKARRVNKDKPMGIRFSFQNHRTGSDCYEGRGFTGNP